MRESGNVTLQAIRLIKAAILQSRYMAARLANKEQLKLYYAIGKYVSENSRTGKWGTGSISIISNQLQQELPGLKGFSVTNIRYMRLFFEAWSSFFEDSTSSNHHLASDDLHQTSDVDTENQLITESGIDLMALSLNHHSASDDLKNFLSIGFTHHREILGKTSVLEERLFYINHCAVGFWSVETLKYHLREDLFAKQSSTLNNFNLTISQNDIRAKALHSFKDEYLLDYINLEDPDDSDERVLESVIVSNIKNFKPDKRDKVLDFGSGVGRLSSFLSPFVKSIVGIDASKTMIDVAEKNRKEQNIEYIHVDTTVIPKVDNSFDKAFAYWVFASISDKMLEENISEIFRVLKPNGRLFFFEQVKKESAYDSNVHKKRTITEYKELLEQHNFVFIHTKEIQRNPSYAMHIWKKYRFLPSFLLPLMYHLEQLTLYRKPEFADYYTNVFVFEKRI